MKRILITIFVILFCCSFTVRGQSTGHNSLAGIMGAIDSLHKRQPAEKLYLHMDKPYYAIGDTMRFKAYLLDENLFGSLKSGILYVELMDSTKVFKRETIILKEGITWGDIIIKKSWHPGNYTLRAFTNWMRNLGTAHFFTRQITVVSTDTRYWLVNSRSTVDKDKKVNVALQFSDLAHKAINAKELQVSVLDGKIPLSKNSMHTDALGKLNIGFTLPEKKPDQQFFVVAEEIIPKGNNRKIVIPIQLNRPENTDVQFMPEGGSLINGMFCRVGFKAIGEDGMGVPVSGKIVDSKQQQVAVFKSGYKGIGSFEFTPVIAETYTALVTLADSSVKSYPLPATNSSGIALRVEALGKDSLQVTVKSTADLSGTYYLVGQSRDKVLFGTTVPHSTIGFHKKLAKNIFPTGIVKWVLFDGNNKPISQRMSFIDHDDRLNISLTTDKNSYGLRSGIAAKLAVTDAAGNPVQASFSLAVTDDSQVRTFDDDADNIASHMLLNPDLKGNIEEPGYYFNKDHTDRLIALDNLLITQGWADYDWKKAFDPATRPAFEAEPKFAVNGRLTGGASNSDVMLISTRPEILLNTQTDKEGKFSFSNLPLPDTINFRIQAKHAVEVNEFVPPEFIPLKTTPTPWYVNSDTTMINYVKQQAGQDAAFDEGKSTLLQEVVINGRKIRAPLLQLDEEEILDARKGPKPMTVWDLLNQKENIGKINMRLLIDGQMLMVTDFTHPMKPGVQFDIMKDSEAATHPGGTKDVLGWLEEFKTEDIKSLVARLTDGGSGVGPLLMVSVGTKAKFGDNAMENGDYIYRPMPISWPHRFYSPRYIVKDYPEDKDRRSTIYWAPDLVTDSAGKTHRSFYSADVPGTYTLIVEGAGLDGNIGYARLNINVGTTGTGNNNLSPALKSVVEAIDDSRKRLSIEKLYVQTDKPYYTQGDTLRFKSYLFNAAYLGAASNTGLLYVELDDASNQSAKRIMVPVGNGKGWGDMALDEKELPPGSYTLRAYTNWMRNFGEDYIFKKNIYISPVNSASTLIKTGFRLESSGDKSKVTAAILFTGLDGEARRLKDMQLRVMNGKRTLFRDRVTTDMGGKLLMNFDLADKTAINNLTIRARQTAKDADTTTLTIPVTINRPENTDLQFMPEGGNMVAGIPTRVGFKAINEDGKGVTISGKITNSKQQEVARFTSTHKGMGSFELNPLAGESYTATVGFSNGTTKNYSLPAVNPSGTALSVSAKNADSLEVCLSATMPGTFYLIGQSRGVVYYAGQVDIKTLKQKITIAKELFPTGIVHFTLLNAANVALNERIVYINKNDNLLINITQNKLNYNIRDSIALNLQVKTKDGSPVQGTFAIAVTDGSQVKTDSVGSNIINNLLLTSDLKGTVEEPGWYFDPDSYQDNTPERATALDNLLLTQGWVGYDWKAIFGPKTQQPKYAAEKEFTVQGNVTNIFNKPIKQSVLTLLQRQPFLVMDVLTNDEGRFIFKSKNLLPLDTPYYLIQAKNKNGGTFNVGIDVDEFITPVFSFPKQLPSPWYVNSDTSLLNNAHTKMAQLKAEADYMGEGHLLKEVNINEKKIIPGSHNRNGPGEADITLDEKDMNAAKKMSLFELLRQKFKNVYRIPTIGGFVYYFKGRLVYMKIDGDSPAGGIDYMDYLSAEDIKGVEVMVNPRYETAYDPNIVRQMTTLPDKYVPIYLEITTYSGHGAYMKRTPGRYEYKPMPYSLPKEFYSPKYTAKNIAAAPGIDLRSTIYWKPNIITDRDGKATVSFYSADKPADYTLILEGTDLNGNLGYLRQKIKVMAKATKK